MMNFPCQWHGRFVIGSIDVLQKIIKFLNINSHAIYNNINIFSGSLNYLFTMLEAIPHDE